MDLSTAGRARSPSVSTSAVSPASVPSLPVPFAVSYSFFGDRTPFLQHAAIAASMAVVRPLDSLADVDMVDVSWVFFVPRPSA